MNIICPHCTTSYGVDPASFGPGGRTVRCARCKETWIAHPERVRADAGEAGWDTSPEPGDWSDTATPTVDSPPIAGEWREPSVDSPMTIVPERDDLRVAQTAPRAKTRGLRGMWRRNAAQAHAPRTTTARAAKKPLGWTISCATMGALAIGLVTWRAEVVRLLPQTASFFKLAGMNVNLRGLTFENVRITTETVDNKAVMVIEGAIRATAMKPMDVPRLRFIVHDAKGANLYAWNAVLDPPIVQPGERLPFRSRLAAPPPEGREIEVRFFNRRDIAAGGA